ncbi:MAG: RNA polymerase sigma factor [Oscillospiraceae bacterium]
MVTSCDVPEYPPTPSEDKSKFTIDETIFIKIAEGDTAAFEEFFRQTESSIYAFALSILKHHEDALDVMQDSYLKIRAAAHLYKPMGKPMAWVFTIVKNLAMSKLRSKGQTVQIEDMENDPSLSYIIDNEDKFVLQSVLKLLNEQEREIILLHAIWGLSHSEIAVSLGMPISTVLSKYHRGLKKLRNYIEERQAQE